MRFIIIALASVVTLASCSDIPEQSSEPIDVSTDLYFPPTNSNSWETLDINDMAWNTAEVQDLYNFLEAANTRAFIILKDGKIVIEEYWGNNFHNTATFTAETNWYWASASKAIISFLIGIAQQEGNLNINNKSADYLGQGWTAMPIEMEEKITLRDHLTMTTGLDYIVRDPHCTDPHCLDFKATPGTEWFYYNAPYLLLKDIITKSTGVDYKAYTTNKLENLIGMDGAWIETDLEPYWSTARDMARFGLLIMNKGKWGENPILADLNYFSEMTSTSQNLNPSYGYLFWLNGKSSIIYPSLPTSFDRQLSPSAPADLYAAIGRNGQIIDIIPSENMVVVRMGELPDDSLVPVSFHNEMWKYLSRIVGSD